MLGGRRKIAERRSLRLEALEDRTVLSPGMVTAVQDPQTGFLTITGDNGDDSITLTQVGNQIVLTGIDMTTVNQPNQTTATFPNVTGIGITLGDGQDSVAIDSINIPGLISIIEGTGNNDFVGVNHSTFQQLDTTVGREQNGANGGSNAQFFQDVITGDHVNVSLLNESGVSGRRLGSRGNGTGSVINLFMDTLQFQHGGNLNVRADDGIPYNTFSPASRARINRVSTTGNAGIVLGDHFENVTTDNNTTRNLTLSVGSDNDVVDVTDNTISRSETITVGNNSPAANLFAAPSVTVRGIVGSGAANDALRLTVGSNTNTTEPAWPVSVNNTTINGDLRIVAGNGVATTVDPTSDSGRLDITMGSGGVNGLESLTMLGVMSSDPVITFASNVGDTVNINLRNVVITDPFDIFFMQDTGHGRDNVTLSQVHVAGFLFVLLSDSGHNVVIADHVTTTFGFIFGGAGFGDQYIDQGGNSGFFVFGFP